MLISSALAHGTTNDGHIGGMMPLVVIGAVFVFALYLVARSQWHKYRAKRKAGDE